MHTINTVRYTFEYFWTHHEILELEKHQPILETLEKRIKRLVDDITYGFEILEKIQQYI